MNRAGKDKYRPYFSSEELKELILCLKQNPTPKRMGLIQYLESFGVKIAHGIIGASATVALSLAEKLDLVQEESSEHADEILHNAWKLAPETLNPRQIESVMEYRYSHDLMTQKEENEYESAKGLV